MGLKSILANEGKQSLGLRAPLQLAGAPTSGASGSYLGRATVGSLLIDTTNGKAYICTVSTPSTITWVSVGSQT